MNYDEYALLTGHRWSDIKCMNDGPRTYRAHMDDGKGPDTDAMAFGRAAHVAAFEPDLLPLRFCIWDGGTRRGKDWDSFLDANAGKEPLRASDYLRILQLRDAVHSHPEARKILDGAGEYEKTVNWTDPESGLPCKSRLDSLTLDREPFVDDLKTTGTFGDLHLWRNQAARLLYHGQLGMYRDGVKVALGVECGARFIVAETAGAFEVAVLTVSSAELWAGSDLFHILLNRIAECEAAGEWPFRFPEAEDFDLPAWAYADEYELETP